MGSKLIKMVSQYPRSFMYLLGVATLNLFLNLFLVVIK